jgi:integrase
MSNWRVEMLGHADIAITLRIYGHVLPQMHEAAAAMMDTVFAKRA